MRTRGIQALVGVLAVTGGVFMLQSHEHALLVLGALLYLDARLGVKL